MESYYDIPTLTADQRFRDSMRLIWQYSLLPFMTPRQFFYLRVVLEFYHTMTSRGVPSPLEIRFSIDSRPGVLQAVDITAAIGLQVVMANSADHRWWPQLSHPESRSDPIGGSEPVSRCETQDWDSLPDFFLNGELVPVGMAHIL